LIVFQLRNCVQLYRATWEEPKPPAIPKWRLELAEEYLGKQLEDEENIAEAWKYQPPPILQPKRETLVVSVGEAQWDGFLKDTNTILNSTYTKANSFVKQIGKETELN